jgi:cytochrome P450
MMMHPEIQRKAQAEIDRVVGSDRFPTFADQADLPYVDAVVKEVLRWKPVVPLGKYTGDVMMWHLLSPGTNYDGSR